MIITDKIISEGAEIINDETGEVIANAHDDSVPQDFNEQADDKQARIAEAEKFFNLIFGAVHETKFSYLWLKRDDAKKTVPFDISTAERRRAMAQKAIEYSDSGFDVYFCTGLLDEPPKENERGTEDKITCRPVVVCDVDTLGGKHTNPKKYPAPSSVKDFLPFNLSVLVDSGYGGRQGQAAVGKNLRRDSRSDKEGSILRRKLCDRL